LRAASRPLSMSSSASRNAWSVSSNRGVPGPGGEEHVLDQVVDVATRYPPE
jgi:hypothetical protein